MINIHIPRMSKLTIEYTMDGWGGGAVLRRFRDHSLYQFMTNLTDRLRNMIEMEKELAFKCKEYS